MTKDARTSLNTCVMKHVYNSPKFLRLFPFRTNMILTVGKSEFFLAGANVTLRNNNDTHSYIQYNIDIKNVLKRTAVASSFESTYSRYFYGEPMLGDDCSHCFAPF